MTHRTLDRNVLHASNLTLLTSKWSSTLEPFPLPRRPGGTELGIQKKSNESKGMREIVLQFDTRMLVTLLNFFLATAGLLE